MRDTRLSPLSADSLNLASNARLDEASSDIALGDRGAGVTGALAAQDAAALRHSGITLVPQASPSQAEPARHFAAPDALSFDADKPGHSQSADRFTFDWGSQHGTTGGGPLSHLPVHIEPMPNPIGGDADQLALAASTFHLPATGVDTFAGRGAGSQISASAIAFNAMHGNLSMLDTHLAALYFENSGHSTAQAMSGFTSTVHDLENSLVDAQDRTVNPQQGLAQAAAGPAAFVKVDFTAKDGDGATLLHNLENSLGTGFVHGASYGGMAGGEVSVSDIAKLLNVADLGFARESGMMFNVGLVTSQTDGAVHAGDARADFGVDGSGLTIGVLSDSFNHTSPTVDIGGGTLVPDTMAQDISDGDLPASTQVFADASGEDEGRGMAQTIHDEAPGAAITFETAFDSEASFAANIVDLAEGHGALNAQIIVDDVSYFDEPFFQDGIISQAVDHVVESDGVMYFSSAANNGSNGFEAIWRDSGVNGGAIMNNDELVRFHSGANGQFETVTVGAHSDVIFDLDWDQPDAAADAGLAGSQDDLNLYLLNSSGTSVFTSSTDNNINGDPNEIAEIDNSSGSAQTFDLAIGLHSGVAPGRFRIVGLDNGANNGTPIFASSTLNINTGASYGHNDSLDGIGVAAASFLDTPAFATSPAQLEYFSSTGTSRILFDTSGNRLAAAVLHTGPQITAADGGDTSFFGFQVSDGDNFPNFFGTSQAAPDAASVAALIKSANGALTNADVFILMQDTATDMDNPYTAGFDTGVDVATGAGLIDAHAAVQAAETGIVFGGPSHPVLTGTHLDDTFSMAGFFSSTSSINGGTGNDTVLLNGDYSGGVIMGATTMLNVEAVRLGSGHSYNLTTNDATVSGVHALIVDGSLLGAADLLTFNGVHETTGAFSVTGGADGDTITGGGGSDVLSGGAGDDVIKSGAGNDIISGGTGNDIITMAADLTAADRIDGGVGADRVNLAGDYSVQVKFTATTMTNVETVGLTAGHSYSLQTNESTVAAGQTLTIAGSTLGAADVLTFNGVHETDGAFVINAGAGNDILHGGAGADRFVGGGGADTLTGGGGADVFAYGPASDSTGATRDHIVGFDAASNKIDLNFALSVVDAAVVTGSLSTATFDTDLAAAIGSAQLGVHHAVLFTPDAGTLSGKTFLVIEDNGAAGYQAGGHDLVVQLDSAVNMGSFGAANFV